MKRRKSKDIYYDKITYENLFNMWNIVKRTCKDRKAVFEFSLNLNANLNNIYDMLINKIYKPERYKTFIIFEPKPRLVMSQSVTDKIVNHFVANYYLIPLLESSLIDTNVATRVNKGSDYAMNLLKSYFNKLLINNKDKEIYCLKIDVSKYFYTIDHNILFSMLEKRIYDNDVLNLIKIIVSETNKEYINYNVNICNRKYNVDIPFYKENKGLSIGAMVSQFLAIFYLNELDHYIKETLGCKYYIRYMDDLLLLDTDKEKLKIIWKDINSKFKNLELTMNIKSNLYRSSNGFIFLGYKYKVINNKLVLSYNSKTYYRIKRNLYKLHKIDKVKYMKSLGSYKGYFDKVKKIEKRSFRMKTIEVYNSYKEKYKDTIIIIKEGLFYKTYNEDAKVIWYLFDYKYINNVVSFGTSPYDKVIDKIKKYGINFIVIDKNEEVIKFINNSNNYLTYLEMALNNFEKEENKKEIYELVNTLIDNDINNYNKINNYLKELI